MAVAIGRVSELVSSESVGWRSLRLNLNEIATTSDAYETPQFPGVIAHVFLSDECRREVFVSGRWRPVNMDRGRVATTPVGETWRLRYNNRKLVNKHRLVHLHIPAQTFEGVVQQLPQDRTKRRRSVYTAIAEDKTLTQFGLTLVRAIQAGAPDFYAQTCAHWLSAHLLMGAEQTAKWAASLDSEHISDARLVRVLEYVGEHLDGDLSLKALAREADLNEFQFARLFQRGLGKSPHRHVLHLRLQNAARLLSETRRTVSEIALLCGFNSASHFGAAFRQHYSQSPSEYRFVQKWAELGLNSRD